jgi:hypothetical protein
MSLGSALYTILRLNSDVVSTFGTRIYPIFVPENASAKIPALTYQQTGLTPNDTKDQYSTCWNLRQVQITIYCHSYANAETYADYVETALIRYTGTIAGITFKSITLTDESFDANTDFTVQGDSKNTAVFMAILNFNIATE